MVVIDPIVPIIITVIIIIAPYPRGRPQKYRTQNGRQETVIIEGKTAPIFGLNDAVIHPSLGAGTVVGVEAEKVSVIFTNGKSAKVMANYLTMNN